MISHICSRFADVSSFRQVPDAQEVFVDTASEGSLTLELLERQDAATDAEAMGMLWRDAAEQNGVDPTDMTSLVLLSSGAFEGGGGRVHKMGAHVAAVQQARGWMRAIDHGAPAAGATPATEASETQDEGVMVSMVLLRLATFETDVLVTFNLPGPRPPAEASAEAAAVAQPAVAVRSHHDILSAYYAAHDPAKTAEQIATILVKRNDGGPFWWPKLCDAVSKKYSGALPAMGEGRSALVAEASEILRVFVAELELHDTGLFSGGSGA